jgi:hypothetical protein
VPHAGCSAGCWQGGGGLFRDETSLGRELSLPKSRLIKAANHRRTPSRPAAGCRPARTARRPAAPGRLEEPSAVVPHAGIRGGVGGEISRPTRLGLAVEPPLRPHWGSGEHALEVQIAVLADTRAEQRTIVKAQPHVGHRFLLKASTLHAN